MSNGFPQAQHTAPLHKRYIGKYYYSAYWNAWDEILGFDRFYWIVRDIAPGSAIRRHCTPLHANKFADLPFKVRSDTPI